MSCQVTQFVRPFNEDGRSFIRNAADSVLEASRGGDAAVLLPPKPSRKSKQTAASAGSGPLRAEREPKRVLLPPTISHFVMNLPASAITFLRHYRGLYAGHEALFRPSTGGGGGELPLVHVHCFSLKSDDSIPLLDICERISAELGVAMRPGDGYDEEGQVAIHDVRDVAPAKRMFCATFRLPREVAFASRD